jgi:HD-GYP domain-containing protein (c-di-GMP phosphodiesterase class II)
MSDTRVLLTKIAALRQRLERTPVRTDEPATDPERARGLEQRLEAGSQYDALLDRSFKQLVEPASGSEETRMPARLTARAHRLLQVGHGLLGQLRILGDLFGREGDGDALAERYRETVAIADTALRTVQAYPDSPSVQLRLCDGLEGILGVVAERVAALQAAAAQRRREADRIALLAGLLQALASEQAPDLKQFIGLAEGMLADAGDGASLRFYLTESVDAGNPARFIARHSLTVAAVMARLVRNDADLRGQAMEGVLAALIHDVGMLRLPPETWAHARALDETQRRLVETHPRTGAELVARLLPDGGWLAEATLSHHERLDGTGYPVGLREAQVPILARLLSVCDVYAALCSFRPHRAALEPRTALTDTLLLADKGALDRVYAERLLHLSFYPVGSVVELADGAVAVVVATHMGRADLNAPARPVVALLTNNQGQLHRPRPAAERTTSGARQALRGAGRIARGHSWVCYRSTDRLQTRRCTGCASTAVDSTGRSTLAICKGRGTPGPV